MSIEYWAPKSSTTIVSWSLAGSRAAELCASERVSVIDCAVPIRKSSQIVDFGLRITSRRFESAHFFEANVYLQLLQPSPETVAETKTALSRGELVILPTDTVYGIAADIRNNSAVRVIYAAKHRSPDFPLQLLFGRNPAALDQYAEVTTTARRLVDALGPGGWTIIVPAKNGWDSPALSGGRTVGFRMVPVDVTLDIVDALGAPVAASSANISEGKSPVTCDEAVSQVGEWCGIAIDGGPTVSGIDSTVIDLSKDAPQILREGAIDRATVARILGLTQIPVQRSVRS
ncbi:MAG: L-threonylcarbamoyladenylate synthase [Dehalococcoidia bacterium]